MIVDILVLGALAAGFYVIWYAWKHRKRTQPRKRVKLDRIGERYGKSRAGEREWGKPCNWEN